MCIRDRQMQVQIFIDCSASMGKDNPKKAAYVVATAAALGFLAVQNMDKASFYLMKGDNAENENGTIVGKNAFFRAVKTLENIDFDGETDIEKCVTNCRDTGTNNGLTVIVSDFFTDSNWKKAVDYLAYKKRQVLLVQVLTPEEIKAYANHYLPDDICIREVSGVSERFHARLNAKGKVYQYTCYIGDEKPVFERLYTWVLPEWVTNGTPDRMPDIEAMQKAAEYLIGTHDFKSFCGNNKMKKSTVRTIYDITIAEEEGYLRMTFHGNGFLQNMVRILTGTLLEVGKGDYPPEKVKEILAAKDRKMAGATARPEGLTLVQIRYPEWDFE